MKISNRNARNFVGERKQFKANNMFAETYKGIYAVFSYGYHFPLFAYFDGTWYENGDKYSVTTSKHKSQARPLEKTVVVNTRTLKEIIKL